MLMSHLMCNKSFSNTCCHGYEQYLIVGLKLLKLILFVLILKLFWHNVCMPIYYYQMLTPENFICRYSHMHKPGMTPTGLDCVAFFMLY